jgi:5'-3' exonuclease
MTYKVLIDADPLAYRAVFSKGGDTLSGVVDKINDLYQQITESIEFEFGNDLKFYSYLTGSNNFRHDVAKDYKGQRPKEKPALINFARDYIEDQYDAVISDGEEADDAIAIMATKYAPKAIVVSIDKDFKQVPCILYNPVKKTFDRIDHWNGLRFFYQQMLTGDRVDNIHGVFKIGPVKALKILEGAKTERELWERCLEAYEGDIDRAVMNGRLLWLRRHEGQLWEPPK